MPEVELRADFDRDGRLSGAPAEYAARSIGHGAILGVNVDRDGRGLPPSARVGRPVQLDFARPLKSGADNDPIVLQARVSAAAVAAFTSLVLRVGGDNADAVGLLDDRARVIRGIRSASGGVQFPLPRRAGTHTLRLEASRVPGSPLGQSDGALTLTVVGRDAADRETVLDEGRFLLTLPLVLDDLAPASALYICSLPDNVPAVSDVRAGLASVRPAVELREIALADNRGDAWVQDQFQLGYLIRPGGTMRTIVHMPRLRTNAQVGANQRNLAELVRTHFPSTDLGLIDDFWQRTVPLNHGGGVAQLTFTESELAFRTLHRVFIADSFLRESIDRLCALLSPAPAECSNVPEPSDFVPTVRVQLPELARRVDKLLRQVSGSTPATQHAGLQALHDRADRLMRDVNATLGVSGPRGNEAFALTLGTNTYRLDGGELVGLTETVWRMHDSLVYGGNVEASPPLRDHPFGKVVIGESDDRLLDPAVRGLFEASSAVQPLVTLDTAWLGVGHVDELVTFLPTRRDRSSSVVFRASPEVAKALFDKASELYNDGLPTFHPDRNTLWRPLTLQRHRMKDGTHPVTRLFRGKLWLHAHPRPRPPRDDGDDSRADQDVGEVLLPPRIYLRLVDWYSGLLGESLAPFYPDSNDDIHYYKAALTMWDFDFFEGGTNDVIGKEKLGALDAVLQREFREFPIRRVPVLFDRARLADRPPRLGVGATAAFTPNVVNLQFLNGTVLIPNPFGPRMKPADAVAVVKHVLEEQELGSVASRVTASYFSQQGLDVLEVWVTPSLGDAQIATPFRSAADLAEEFSDGFPGVAAATVERRIRRANRSAFEASGQLREGWRKIVIPENTVDLLQAYTHALLDAHGIRVCWVDSWFYHVRVGEIHCGTNVLRQVPAVRDRWWNRVTPPGGRRAPTTP
jgi:Protein-arginine deiminase (PAD)